MKSTIQPYQVQNLPYLLLGIVHGVIDFLNPFYVNQFLLLIWILMMFIENTLNFMVKMKLTSITKNL